MRYRCLVLDHDDTVTDSTAHVHHPAFLAAMREMRPDVSMSLDEYFSMNFSPGIQSYFSDTLRLSDAELRREYDIWQSFVRARVPHVYPGMARIIRRQTEQGGSVCVVSHSVGKNILRDYRENGLPAPALVYGWELPEACRKPSPYALHEIMRTLSLAPEDLLVVDDLKPGYDMARAAGVPFAAACWAHHVPSIVSFMQANSDVCFSTPEALEAYLFDS